MNKLQTIITEVVTDIRKMIHDAINKGEESITIKYEKKVGDAYIDIEMWESYYHDQESLAVKVEVNHIDTKHHSPRLENFIFNRLPLFFKRRVKEGEKQTA